MEFEWPSGDTKERSSKMDTLINMLEMEFSSVVFPEKIESIAMSHSTFQALLRIEDNPRIRIGSILEPHVNAAKVFMENRVKNGYFYLSYKDRKFGPGLFNPVLRDWACRLNYREQGTLLTGIRGCDLAPKYPLDSTARNLTAALRYVAMNAADLREVDSEPGCFMISAPPKKWKPSELGHYPQHWYAHIMHCAEVVAYRHPNRFIKESWMEVYASFCKSLHLPMETEEQMVMRLSEDRIASGEIVS